MLSLEMPSSLTASPPIFRKSAGNNTALGATVPQGKLLRLSSSFHQVPPISSSFPVQPGSAFSTPSLQITGPSATLVNCPALPSHKGHRKTSTLTPDLTQGSAYCGLCAPSGSVLRGLHGDHRHGTLRVLFRVGLHNLPRLLHPGDSAVQKVAVILHGREKERATPKPYTLMIHPNGQHSLPEDNTSSVGPEFLGVTVPTFPTCTRGQKI